MISVVCFLWKDQYFKHQHRFRYTPEHVVRLHRSVTKHLSMPHRFICITDRPQTALWFPDDVEVVPMWDDLALYGGCYRRLKVFAYEMRDILGARFVSMDLDCVVTGSLDPLFSRQEDFVIWKDPSPRQPYCGSMFMMNAGARREVWEKFDKSNADLLKKNNNYIGTDQAWIASMCKGEAMWDEKDGVYSILKFKKGKMGTIDNMARHGLTSELPDGCRIVFFHGKSDPSMKKVHPVLPWIRDHWGPPFETVTAS